MLPLRYNAALTRIHIEEDKMKGSLIRKAFFYGVSHLSLFGAGFLTTNKSNATSDDEYKALCQKSTALLAGYLATSALLTESGPKMGTLIAMKLALPLFSHFTAFQTGNYMASKQIQHEELRPRPGT